MQTTTLFDLEPETQVQEDQSTWVKYEAYYNVSAQQVLVYAVLNGEAITDYLYDVSDVTVKVTRDANNNAHIEFMLDGDDMRRLPLLGIRD